MNATDALRFLAHEAQRCRDRDAHESLCLLLPSVLNALDLEPMHYADSLDFHIQLRTALRERAKVLTGADFPS